MSTVSYFVQELQDAAVARRVRMIEAGGANCKLLGFDRLREAGPRPTPDGAIVLGQTRNGRLFERVFSVLRAIPRAWAQRAAWRDADLIIARNLEMLALARILAMLTGARARLVYECLDIHRMMLGDNTINKVMRALERKLLRRVDTLITSSPAFVTHYFAGRQNYRGEIAIFENKVMAIDETPQQNEPNYVAPAGPPWRIVWCGVLRCAQSLELLCELARSRPDTVCIEVWGMPAYDQIPDFDARVATAGHAIAFKGRYAERDLAHIYGQSHFAWAIDFYEAGGNSDWLLPNRLYESLAFGAAPIAVDGVATAEWLKTNNVGAILLAPLDQSIVKFVDAMTQSGYENMAAAIDALDIRATRFTRADCKDALRALLGDEAKKAAS